jgi:hypothetical protein
VVTGQIRPFFLIFRTGPPYSRPYDILDAFFDRHPRIRHKGVAKVFT